MSQDINTDDSFSMKMTCYGIRKRFPNVQQISTQTLSDWIDIGKPVTVLDTRPEEEFQISKIAGAERCDPDNIESCMAKVQDILKDKPLEQTVVCYCSVGYRSSLVADKLMSKWKNDGNESASRPVYNLEGSLFKWANENRPLVDSNNKPTIYVHPYSSLWGKLLDCHRRFDPQTQGSQL